MYTIRIHIPVATIAIQPIHSSPPANSLCLPRANNSRRGVHRGMCYMCAHVDPGNREPVGQRDLGSWRANTCHSGNWFDPSAGRAKLPAVCTMSRCRCRSVNMSCPRGQQRRRRKDEDEDWGIWHGALALTSEVTVFPPVSLLLAMGTYTPTLRHPQICRTKDERRRGMCYFDFTAQWLGHRLPWAEFTDNLLGPYNRVKFIKLMDWKKTD